MIPVNKLIDMSVKCGKCGTKGFLKCDCYHQCPHCPWIVEKGKRCSNSKNHQLKEGGK